MNTFNYKVILKPLSHRGQQCFAIGFAYHEPLKAIIKSIPYVQWSQQNKSFYVKQQQYSLKKIFALLQEKGIYVDYSALLHTASIVPVKTKKSTQRTISEENKSIIRSFVDYLRGLRLSENTVKVYFTFVADFVEYIGKKPLEELSNLEVRKFVEQQVIQKKYSISTHRQMISALKHFARFLPDSKIEDQALPRPTKSRYLPTVLSKEEIIDILRATKNLKHRTVIALLYSAGLRISEVLNLQLRDIDVDRRQLFIKNAKGRKDRVVVLAESFIPLYRNYYMTYQPKTYFIESPSFGKYSAGSIRSFLKQSCKRAGVGKRVTPHTLRHSYATHLIENGVGLRHVQDLLGHSKPETTMIYTHIAKKDLLEIQSPLDTAFIALSETDKKEQRQTLSGNIFR